MRTLARWAIGFVACSTLGGCRTASHLTTVPRVDLELEGAGNRGYQVGKPPAPPVLKTTRQMIQTDIEIPSLYKPERTKATATLESPAQPAPGASEVSAQAAPPEAPSTYVVQKGDSLWSIAAKPEVYGKASHWRRLFDANRGLLKTPDQLKAGMTLKVPRGEETGGGTASSDEGTTFKK